jgi:Obg family GTPase CgtA-like protein
MAQAWDKLQSVLKASPAAAAPEKIFRPQPKDAGITVHREGDTFVIEAPGLARMVSGTGEITPELLGHVREHLARQGYERLLRRAGIKFGDKVRCGLVEWEWLQ